MPGRRPLQRRPGRPAGRVSTSGPSPTHSAPLACPHTPCRRPLARPVHDCLLHRRQLLGAPGAGGGAGRRRAPGVGPCPPALPRLPPCLLLFPACAAPLPCLPPCPACLPCLSRPARLPARPPDPHPRLAPQVPVALSAFSGKHMHLFLRKDPARMAEDVLEAGNATGGSWRQKDKGSHACLQGWPARSGCAPAAGGACWVLGRAHCTAGAAPASWSLAADAAIHCRACPLPMCPQAAARGRACGTRSRLWWAEQTAAALPCRRRWARARASARRCTSSPWRRVTCELQRLAGLLKGRPGVAARRRACCCAWVGSAGATRAFPCVRCRAQVRAAAEDHDPQRHQAHPRPHQVLVHQKLHEPRGGLAVQRAEGGGARGRASKVSGSGGAGSGRRDQSLGLPRVRR